MKGRWRVFEPALASVPSEDARFVKDGFSPVAFVAAPLWLFWHRLWAAGAAVVAVEILLAVAGRWSNLPWGPSALSFLLGLGIALEGSRLVARRLERKGWRESAVFVAQGRAEAEFLYFGEAGDEEPLPRLRPAGRRGAPYDLFDPGLRKGALR